MLFTSFIQDVTLRSEDLHTGLSMKLQSGEDGHDVAVIVCLTRFSFTK